MYYTRTTLQTYLLPLPVQKSSEPDLFPASKMEELAAFEEILTVCFHYHHQEEPETIFTV